ncbi:MAG: glycosyltransferase family 2 protein [Methanoregulaceae archaeon]|nr:glycosyltransferase family 2 protein [Methanoregulaceae archaeon]MCU0629205.1 glycosyltransferase family 2 protein [Methanoregulaceae archaeon]
MTGVEISAVIPAYNDRVALAKAIPLSISTLEAVARDFELIVAEDGSTDGSAELVRSWTEKDPRVHLLHSDERLGRGKALNRAFSAAEGRIVCYYDVDLATDMKHLKTLVGAIRDGYDIATGSRLLPESRIQRSGGREIASRGYNLLVRTVLGSRLHDHQCGFKAFSRDRVLAVIPSVRDTHWFWDTEVLVRAGRNGYRICEFPVIWQQGEKTTVRRHDVWDMGTAVLRLWWQLHVSKD